MRSTPEEIERLIKLFGYSLSDLPKPQAGYAYDFACRREMGDMAMQWEQIDYNEEAASEDFMCHQSDVIELLVYSLRAAIHRLENPPMNVSCSGKGVAIGQIHGGLTIKR